MTDLSLKIHPDDENPKVGKKCLIAMDVDKTILIQGEGEKKDFKRLVANPLAEAAAYGTHLSFITGNSMHELCSRSLKWTIEHLCYEDNIEYLGQFHFFSNAAGVYSHFPLDDPEFAKIIADKDLRKDPNHIYNTLTREDPEAKERSVYPRFINKEYLRRTRLAEEDVEFITSVLEEAADKYVDDLAANWEEYEELYDFDKANAFDKKGYVNRPEVQLREVEYDDGKFSTTQITLKTLLSFRHGISEEKENALFQNDLRTQYVNDLQSSVDSMHKEYIEGTGAGRGSVDFTKSSLDKAFAVRFLIEHLNLQGSERLDRKFGANTIYLADEVITGGNDYPVTSIDGVTTYAVNEDRDLVPFLPNVLIPYSNAHGPKASARIIGLYNDYAGDIHDTVVSQIKAGKNDIEHKSPLDVFKAKVLKGRIDKQLDVITNRVNLNPDDLEMIHAVTTILSRDTEMGKQWVKQAISSLSSSMLISRQEQEPEPALGNSVPDWKDELAHD